MSQDAYSKQKPSCSMNASVSHPRSKSRLESEARQKPDLVTPAVWLDDEIILLCGKPPPGTDLFTNVGHFH